MLSVHPIRYNRCQRAMIAFDHQAPMMAAGLLLAGIGSSVEQNFGILLTVVGLAVAAIATYRTRSPQLVRQENADLRERNHTLTEAMASANTLIHEQGLKIKLLEDQVAALIAKDTERIYDLMKAHDDRTRELGNTILKLLRASA